MHDKEQRTGRYNGLRSAARAWHPSGLASATTDDALAAKLEEFRARQTEVARGMTLPVHSA